MRSVAWGMQWFVLGEQGSSPGPGGKGGYGWVGCILAGEGRLAAVKEGGDNSVESKAEAIVEERKKLDCSGEKVEVY